MKTLWEKEKLLIVSNFSSSHSAFYPLGELSATFIKLKNCRLQALPIWKSLKFVVWEKVKDYTTCNSSYITNRQVCANPNSVMLKGFLHGIFVFHQFLFMKQTYTVSILGRAIAGFMHFFQRSRIPPLKLNNAHLLFEGKCLPSLKPNKSLFTQLSFFLNRIHVHYCQLKPTYSLRELLPFINMIN